MATQILINQAAVNGIYDGSDLEVLSTIAETILIDGITADKTADKQIWVNGYLTYTVVLTNTTDLPMTDITFTDNLDPLLISLVSDTVLVNEMIVPYTWLSNILSIPNINLDAQESTIIKFKVQRV